MTMKSREQFQDIQVSHCLENIRRKDHSWGFFVIFVGVFVDLHKEITGLLQLSHLGEVRNYIKKSSHEIREWKHIKGGVFLRILRDYSYRSLFGFRSRNSTKLE